MWGSVEIFDSFHMYISLDNNVYFHTWFMFRLYLYTVDITTARTFIAYISLIFHDSDQGLYICFLLVFGIFRLLMRILCTLLGHQIHNVPAYLSHHYASTYVYLDFFGKFLRVKHGRTYVLPMFSLLFS
jgi:hypothetical protein